MSQATSLSQDGLISKLDPAGSCSVLKKFSAFMSKPPVLKCTNWQVDCWSERFKN